MDIRCFCILSLLLSFSVMGCKDDPIPEGVPTGAVVVRVKTIFDPAITFEKIMIEVDQVQIVHRSNPNDPATEVIYDVNTEVSSLEFFNEDRLTIIGQYEVPTGSVEQIRYRIRSSQIVVNGVQQELKIPSGAQSGLKFAPDVSPSPFIVFEGDIFAVEGGFNPGLQIVHKGNGGYLFKPVLPARFMAINQETGVLGNELVLVAKEGTPHDTVQEAVTAYGAFIVPPQYYNRYRIRLDPSTLIQDAYFHFNSMPWIHVVGASIIESFDAIRPPGEQISLPQETSALPDAWQRAFNFSGSIGNYTPVVAVIDSGIDLRNQDIVLNLWINPGEVRDLNIADTDGDGVITVSDITHSRNAAISPADSNGNGYIDGEDILADVRFADGIDQDGNSYTDDIFGWDFIERDNRPMDDEGHGTSVAGIVGGANNKQGILGATHRVRMAAIRVIDKTGNTSNTVVDSGMEYVQNLGLDVDPANDIDIANVSLGHTIKLEGSNEPCTGKCSIQPLKEYKATMSANIGGMMSFLNNQAAKITWVFSAGNTGANLDSPDIFSERCESARSLIPDRVIVVASVNQALVQSSFTNYGSSLVDIAAPGEHWNLAGLGSGTPLDPCSPFCGGTSFSAPMVSGSLALMISLDSSLKGNPLLVKERFLQAAPDGQSGAPVVDGNFLNLDSILAALGYP